MLSNFKSPGKEISHKKEHRKVLGLIQYTVKKIIISSLKTKKAYSEDVLKKQVKMSQDQRY